MIEHRNHPRYRLRWPVTLILGQSGEEEPAVVGCLHDLSAGGASVHSDRNLRNVEQVTAVLQPPPLVGCRAAKIITVHSKLVYSIHSSAHMCFRAGLQFVRFEADGRDQLAERLAIFAPLFDKLPATVSD